MSASRKSAPEGEEQPQTKKMTQEEIAQMADRLSTTQRRQPELKPLHEKKTISKEDLDKRIKHLYDDSLARRQREREEIAAQQDREIQKTTTMTNRTLSQEDEERMVKHLYDDTIAAKERNLMMLYAQETSHYQRNNKKMSAKEQSSVADRLYGEGMQRERDKRIALYNKFVVERRPPPHKRTQAELAASADKMTKGEGVTS